MTERSELHKQMSIALSSRRERGILRRPHPDAFIPLPLNQSHMQQSQTALAPLVDFSSNDYLSLSTHEPLRRHYLRSLERAPQILGSGGSRLLDGTRPAHLELEQRLAQFFSSPARPLTALLFGSGFDANAALFSSLPQPGDIILYDELIHASVHDGMRASRVSSSRRIAFKHNSVRDLTAKIQDALREMNGNGTIFVGLEALYSMDGDLAPLVEICDIVEALIPAGRAYIVVDEAHSTGIYGRGRGMVEHFGLWERVHIRLHTFGKAMASSGAVVICDALTREYLINYARSFIFTTAPTVASVIAMGCSFDMIENGTAGRICLHAANTEEEVDGLVDALVEWAKVGIQVQSQVQTMATAQSGTVSLPNAKL
ncbi:hypothetical protein FRC09_006714 [Ceratobasidium sp. 395]|nr:hypothetical protein FRC09_006714 [Ceratobasidium sp. 395]